MKVSHSWLTYALLTTMFWGVWGALSATPEKAGLFCLFFCVEKKLIKGVFGEL